MKKLSYLAAAAAIGGFVLAATPASASPLASGLTTGSAAVPQLDEGLVQKVHGWHCSRKWSKRLGKHRHRRACYDDDYGHYGYPGAYGFGAPFFSFSIFDDDDHHGRRGKKFRRRHKGGHKGKW
jgi:hypothetical protein